MWTLRAEMWELTITVSYQRWIPKRKGSHEVNSKCIFLLKQRHEICANWTIVNYKTLPWMGRLRQICKDKKFTVFVTLEWGLKSPCFSRPLKLAHIAIHDDTLFYFCKRNVCCGGFCCFHAMCVFFSFGTKWSGSFMSFQTLCLFAKMSHWC